MRVASERGAKNMKAEGGCGLIIQKGDKVERRKGGGEKCGGDKWKWKEGNSGKNKMAG